MVNTSIFGIPSRSRQQLSWLLKLPSAHHVISLMYCNQHSFSSDDELLQEINWKFGDMDKRTMQSFKIHTMQQGNKPVDEHIQDFEKVALEASYDGYPLVIEFKQSLNQELHRCLTELWPGPITIEQWYDEVIRMDCQWRVARAKEAFYGKVNQSAQRKPPFAQPASLSSSSSALLR